MLTVPFRLPESLKLQRNPEHYQYLKSGLCSTVESIDDKDGYSVTKVIMNESYSVTKLMRNTLSVNCVLIILS